MLAGLDHCSAGTTDRVGAETVLKKHALSREFIDLWGGIDRLQPAIVSADCIWGMVIRKNKDDIWTLLISFDRQADRNQGEQNQGTNKSQYTLCCIR